MVGETIMRIFIISLLLMGTAVAQEEIAQKLIPVKSFPAVIGYKGKTYYNVTEDIAVKAGYRLIPVKPATPIDKVISSEKFVQDDKDPSKVKYEIIYADKPEPTPPPVITNVAADKVTFQFTEDGNYVGMIWNDSPVTTNKVAK